MTGKSILLVEDNADDVELTRIAFAQAGISHALHVVGDGAQALDYLFARGQYTSRDPRDLPALVLLDLNLPRRDGREVLQAIRGNAAMHALPVVVLSSSCEPHEVDAMSDLGANGCIRKPVDFAQFVAEVKDIGRRWLVPQDLPQT